MIWVCEGSDGWVCEGSDGCVCVKVVMVGV